MRQGIGNRLPSARHCAGHFLALLCLNLTAAHDHFVDEDLKAWRGKVTCLRPLSQVRGGAECRPYLLTACQGSWMLQTLMPFSRAHTDPTVPFPLWGPSMPFTGHALKKLLSAVCHHTQIPLGEDCIPHMQITCNQVCDVFISASVSLSPSLPLSF